MVMRHAASNWPTGWLGGATDSLTGGDTAQEVELSSGSRRVAGSIPPWACRSVPEQDT